MRHHGGLFHSQIVAGPGKIAEELCHLFVRAQLSRQELTCAQGKWNAGDQQRQETGIQKAAAGAERIHVRYKYVRNFEKLIDNKKIHLKNLNWCRHRELYRYSHLLLL